ncbi:MAG: hypothetical protein O7A06_12925, partial [Acidobacteria bacterium]|nr:hypothetical protein [Acidobacteriota bacterium]
MPILETLLAEGILKLVGWLARRSGSSYKKIQEQKQEETEDSILEYMANESDWVSPSKVWNKAFLFKIIEDVTFGDAFGKRHTGWPKFKWWWKHLYIEARHRWRKNFHLVPKKK